MNIITERENNLLRRALDKATTANEADTAAKALVASLRTRGISGYDFMPNEAWPQPNPETQPEIKIKVSLTRIVIVWVIMICLEAALIFGTLHGWYLLALPVFWLGGAMISLFYESITGKKWAWGE